MNKEPKYLLIDTSVVPEIFLKVIEVKKLLTKNSKLSVNEAVSKIGISRSAYYKYKDSVSPFYETSRGKVLTLLFAVEDIPGLLSEILAAISDVKANILTIHQNMPINGVADILITIETSDAIKDIQEMLETIGTIKGVKKQEILARE